jgi:hypothetical protein
MRPHFGTPKEIYASVNPIDLGNNSIKIYPNPANDIVYLPRVFSHIRICDVNGKQVLEFWNNSNLNVSGLKEGAYFVLLNDNLKRFYTAKLIIHKK